MSLQTASESNDRGGHALELPEGPVPVTAVVQKVPEVDPGLVEVGVQAQGPA